MTGLHAALDNVSWRVSTRCDGGACVMVECQPDSIIVGNKGQPNGPYLIYTTAAWEGFLLRAKRGDFDHLAR